MLENIAFKILTLYSLALGTPPVASILNDDWNSASGWTKNATGYSLTAKSSRIVETCRNFPASYLNFPVTYYSVMEVRTDGKLVAYHNSIFDSYTETIFTSLTLSCRQVAHYSSLEFTIISPSFYFARLSHFPFVSSSRTHDAVFSRMAYILGFSIMVFLLAFGSIVFRKKLDTSYYRMFLVACLSMAFFCFFCTPGYWGLQIPLGTCHKLVVGSLSLSALCLFWTLAELGLLNRKFLAMTAFVSMVAFLIILLSKTIDVAQSAINVCYLNYFLNFANVTIRSLSSFCRKRSTENLCIVLGILAAVITSFNDCLILLGAVNGVMIFPFGLASLFIAQGFFLHQHFQLVFDERDRFQKSLEEAYQEKLELMEKNAVAHAIASTAQMIAHDLQRPFHLLKMALHQIQTFTQSPASMKNFVSHISESTDFVENLMSDLLVAGKERGIRVEPIHLKEVVESSWRQYQSSGKHKHISIEVLLNCSKLYVDKTKVTRLFANLFSNSLDAMSNGSTMIWIHATDVEKNGDTFAKITFGNEGSFIPQHDLKDLFIKFQTKNKPYGTGLGLAICYEVVKSHGGDIECRSHPEKGTEFIFTLPTVPSL